MSPKQLQILQHALGLDQYGRGKMYRNHFCAGADDTPDCQALIAAGYMQHHRTTDVFPYFNCSVTDAGKAAVLAASPPLLTRAKERYREFLIADSGLSFIEWLKRRPRSTER